MTKRFKEYLTEETISTKVDVDTIYSHFSPYIKQIEKLLSAYAGVEDYKTATKIKTLSDEMLATNRTLMSINSTALHSTGAEKANTVLPVRISVGLVAENVYDKKSKVIKLGLNRTNILNMGIYAEQGKVSQLKGIRFKLSRDIVRAEIASTLGAWISDALVQMRDRDSKK